jgi:imidazoleglycerol-phosphate dehydratase
MTKFAVTNVSCINASKSQHPISTGIGYLDHMIDQLNSHAQVGVSVAVVDCLGGGNNNFDDDGNSHQQRHSYEYVNRYANEDQSEITSLVGSALGERLRSLLTSSRTPSSTNVSRFRCPLDEALVECILATSTTNDGGGGNLVDFDLSPYGIYPPEVGRSRVGTLETSHVTTFFADLAESSGLVISLRKIRGDNGHHVIESAFKAFSRALRNLLDGTNAYDDEYDPVKYELAWGGTMGVPQASGGCDDGAMKRRTGNVERSTKETSISVRVLLSDGILAGDDRRTAGDGPSIIVDTGIKTLDTFVSTLAREAYMSVDVKCTGDLYVDDHHTSEDVSIALGQALDEALGTRAGLNRMWCAIGAYGCELILFFSPFQLL